MSKRTNDYHGGGSGWRFSWRIDRLQKLHELGKAFGLTEASPRPTRGDDQHDPDEVEQAPDDST